MIGSPASFISTQFTGQTLWHLAPQAMHFPSIREALPRGFFTGFTASVMENSFKNLFLTQRGKEFAMDAKEKLTLSNLTISVSAFLCVLAWKRLLLVASLRCEDLLIRFVYNANKSLPSNLSISRCAVPTGSLTPSPSISPLSRSGEKILLTQVGEPLRPILCSSSCRVWFVQVSTSFSKEARRLGTVG